MALSFLLFDARATDANNVSTVWFKCVKRFDNFVVACGIRSDARKTALLLHNTGEEVHDTYCALSGSPATTPAAACSSFAEASPINETARRNHGAYFEPRVNMTFEIYRFRQAKQLEDEFPDAFYARLRQLARQCASSMQTRKSRTKYCFPRRPARLRRYAMLHDLNLQRIRKRRILFREVEHSVAVMEQGR